jgi:hypothetical protein
MVRERLAKRASTWDEVLNKGAVQLEADAARLSQKVRQVVALRVERPLPIGPSPPAVAGSGSPGVSGREGGAPLQPAEARGMKVIGTATERGGRVGFFRRLKRRSKTVGARSAA